jgi:hypothetical protein
MRVSIPRTPQVGYGYPGVTCMALSAEDVVRAGYLLDQSTEDGEREVEEEWGKREGGRRRGSSYSFLRD